MHLDKFIRSDQMGDYPNSHLCPWDLLTSKVRWDGLLCLFVSTFGLSIFFSPFLWLGVGVGGKNGVKGVE